MSAKSTSLLHELRTLPGAFWVLFVGTGINRFGTFVFPFLTIFLSQHGLSLGAIGLVLTGFGVGMLGSTVAGGWCADRFGRRHTIVAGTFGQAVALMALYFAHEPWLLALLTTLSGFAGGFYHPAASALVADLVPAGGRLTAFALLRLAGNSGFAFGTAAGGILVTVSPFWLFAGDALTTLAFGVLAICALPNGRRERHREARWSEALSRLRRDRAFWALALAQLSVAFVFAQFASAYALEVTRRGLSLAIGDWQLSPAQIYGLLIGWNGVLITALELPLTRVTRLLRVHRVMAFGYALIGVGFASNLLNEGLAVLAIGITLFTFGEMLVMPMVGPWISRIAPETMRGRYMGALAASWAVGNIVGQNTGLWLFGVNPAVLWALCAASGALSAVLILLLHRGRMEAPAPSATALPVAAE